MIPLDWIPESLAKEEFTILAKTIWGEAEGETADGQIGVGCVIRNRVEDPGWWGKSFTEVCLKSGQFSCWTERKPKMDALDLEKDMEGRQCQWIAVGIVFNFIHDVTAGADHYLAKWMIEKNMAPKWARGITPIRTIGNHLFYKIGP